MYTNKTTEQSAKLNLIISMFIFGTIGLLIKLMPISAGIIAFVRGIIGALALLIFIKFKGNKLSKVDIKKNLKLLLWSGFLIGANWIFLFEAYNYTTLATATVCYYLAPLFAIIFSVIFLKEKLTFKKIICILIAIVGMFFISQNIQGGNVIFQAKGILYGVLAGVMYALVIILNKKIKDISAYNKTIVQLLMASVIVLGHVLATENISGLSSVLTGNVILLLLIISIFHTGFAYALYFSTMDKLKTSTIAIFSYIDPVIAILLSVLVLKEKMSLMGIIGAILILGATYVSESE